MALVAQKNGERTFVELNAGGRKCVSVPAIRTPKLQDKASNVTNPGESECLISNLEHRR